MIDAVIVLCGGVLTGKFSFLAQDMRLIFQKGIFSACELLEQLARHRVIPQFFLHVLPTTKSPYISVLSFIGFSGVLYASAGANLGVISQM